MRHTAHTSEVDAPQEEQGVREGAGDAMAAVGAGGQREAREIAHACEASCSVQPPGRCAGRNSAGAAAAGGGGAAAPRRVGNKQGVTLFACKKHQCCVAK